MTPEEENEPLLNVAADRDNVLTYVAAVSEDRPTQTNLFPQVVGLAPGIAFAFWWYRLR